MMRVGDNVLEYLKDVIRDITLTANRKHPTMVITTGQLITRDELGDEIATISTVTDQAFNTDADENNVSYFSELEKRMENV